MKANAVEKCSIFSYRKIVVERNALTQRHRVRQYKRVLPLSGSFSLSLPPFHRCRWVSRTSSVCAHAHWHGLGTRLLPKTECKQLEHKFSSLRESLCLSPRPSCWCTDLIESVFVYDYSIRPVTDSFYTKIGA